MRLVFIIAMLVSAGCGKNFFAPYEKKDPAEDATIAMEKQKPDKAIAILQDALAKDPGNHQYMSLLAAATAQKYGVDTISIALAMATGGEDEEEESSSSSATSTNGITKLFVALPAATDANIDGVQSAVDILLSIPEDVRSTADNFYLTLLNTALVGLHTKKFDADGDGQVSPVELLTLDEDDAIAIISSLLAAQQALASGMMEGQSSQNTSGSISSIQAKIDSQPGDSQAEKLRNYLGGGAPPP